ncbi:MAG: SDR family NAD(P)-dependent oxidoreductase, partial [Dokdonella sp.]
MKLAGKVALITGAASGIGKRIAEVYAIHGAAVVIADLRLEQANVVAESIIANGGRALGVAMDVADEAQVEAGVAAAIAAFGQLDILVSNAGIQIIKPIEQFSFAEWRRMMSI